MYLLLAWHELGHTLGINRYACEANWTLDQWQIGETFGLPHFQPHGIISQLAMYNYDLLKAVKDAQVPTVELCDSTDILVPRVMPDAEAAGALAAAHLIGRGFTRFVFVGYSRDTGEQRAFTRAIRDAGGECRMISIDSPEMVRATGKFLARMQHAHDESSTLRQAWARRFFSGCNKPVGVFVQPMTWAISIIEGCRNARILVPEQVAVISLADMLDEGMALPVPLTVVVPDYQEQGYQAAALLDRMMKGEKVPPDTIIRIPPKALVARDSTLCHATDNLPLARAVTFIKRNLHDPALCAKQVQRTIQAPHTKFYRDFSRQFNMPVARYIDHLRIKEAVHLLDTTDATASAIAVQCGFGDLRRFRYALAHKTGMGPAAWRQQNGGALVRQCVSTSVTASRKRDGASVLRAARSVLPPLGVDQCVGAPVRPRVGVRPCLSVGGERTHPPAYGPDARPDSRPDSRPESRPESMEVRVLRLLAKNPLGKKSVSVGLGHKDVSGQLNKTVRALLADQSIEYTMPNKPNSRLQQYRLTDKGRLLIVDRGWLS